jgi:putative membrane protein
MGRPGWAARLRSEGREPDPRFTLANERTFLAWIRTALALVAAGIAVELYVDALSTPVRSVLAGALVAAGVLVSVSAFRRWYASELALRRGEPLPAPGLAPLLAYGVAAVAVVGLVVLLFS